MILTAHETAQKKKIARVLESFVRNLLTALRSIHEDIAIIPFTRKDNENNPYLCVNLPVLSSQEKKTELLIQVKKAILSQGKFSLSNKPDDLTCVTISISFHNLETFKSPDTLTKIEKQSIQKIKETKENQPNLKKEIVMEKNVTTLRDEVRKFLKMLGLDEKHYSQVIPEMEQNKKEGPVFFSQKEIAEHVVKRANQNRLGGLVSYRKEEPKIVYFSIGFKNPLTIREVFEDVITPQLKSSAKPASTPVNTEKIHKVVIDTNKNSNELEELRAYLKHYSVKAPKHYISLVPNTSRDFAAMNSIKSDEIKNWIIGIFEKDNFKELLIIKDGVKSLKVKLDSFKNPYHEAQKASSGIVVKNVKQKKTKSQPKLEPQTDLMEKLSYLTKQTNENTKMLDRILRLIDPEETWKDLQSLCDGHEVELLLRTKTKEGESTIIITKDKFLELHK